MNGVVRNEPYDCLVGGREMGALMRAFDWSRTPAGPQAGWSMSLRTALSMLLHTGYPMYIAWGPEFTQFYNDAYRPILGRTKHPGALGASTRETFAEIWDFIGPMFRDVMEQGSASTYVDQLLGLDRNGYVEECYFTFSYSAIRAEDGTVGGVLVTVLETTARVLGERRNRIQRDLLELGTQRSIPEICAEALEILRHDPEDVPLAILYRNTGQGLEPAGLVGLPPGETLPPEQAAACRSLAQRVARGSGRPGLIEGRCRFEPRPDWSWPEPTESIVALPIQPLGHETPPWVMVTALSPRLKLDETYGTFLETVARNLASVIAEAEAYEHERRKAAELAELDRAKTLFFSNISHEFRTPLTLMLGPVEDMLNEPGASLQPAQRERLELAHRNAQRLLRLVNTLLDFSRLESGRMTASYSPVDLSALTTDLAGVFRSAAERAGLALEVDAPPLPEPLYVDRDMWEKILLNLLSNALKFTFEGRIGVRLRWRGAGPELTVSDTGTGIAPEHLPHLFERFYRVPNASARSHEGSGIGLALVHELVQLHGGSIDVTSEPGRGTTFTVQLKAGRAHLPRERIETGGGPVGPRPDASFVEEAVRWIVADGREEPEPARETSSTAQPLARVLWADDNADMRDYVQRLLSPHWRVHAVANGEQALESARRDPPDLILADVMMPRLDGFGLLRELRTDERTRAIPVILLSARAGEEAKVEGLDAGADDYLIKPFSARELIARVRVHLDMARARHEFARQRSESAAWFDIALSAAGLGAWHLEVESLRGHCDRTLLDIIGLPGHETVLDAQTWQRIVHPDDLKGVLEGLRASIATRAPFDREYRIVRPDGTVRWVMSRGTAVHEAGHGALRLVGVTQDITERKRLIERQQLLLNELNHRVRNTLATVLSLARHTAISADTVGEFITAFEARIAALSAAHGLLTRRNWEAVSLRDVVAETLAPHHGNGALRIEGPDCDVHARHALALTLAMHELATNACKYGALSREHGHIDVAWQVTPREDAQELRLRWVERGGPPVATPKRRGFGSRLIERALAMDLDGEVALDFAHEGVECTIAFTIEEERHERTTLR